MDFVTSNLSSLTIVTCPSCHRAISVFIDTDLDTAMHCPLCQSNYPFRRVIESLPPRLLLESEAAEAQTLSEPRKKVSLEDIPVPAPLKNARRSRRRSSSSSSHTVNGSATASPPALAAKSDQPTDKTESAVDANVSASESKPNTSSTPSGSGNRRRSTRRSKARSKKRSRTSTDKEFSASTNLMREVILFVVGGAMAIPIAQMAAWWLLGIDPLGTGPFTSRFASIAVPQKFRMANTGDAADDSSDSEGGDSKTSRGITLPGIEPGDARFKSLFEEDHQRFGDQDEGFSDEDPGKKIVDDLDENADALNVP